MPDDFDKTCAEYHMKLQLAITHLFLNVPIVTKDFPSFFFFCLFPTSFQGLFWRSTERTMNRNVDVCFYPVNPVGVSLGSESACVIFWEQAQIFSQSHCSGCVKAWCTCWGVWMLHGVWGLVGLRSVPDLMRESESLKAIFEKKLMGAHLELLGAFVTIGWNFSFFYFFLLPNCTLNVCKKKLKKKIF